MTQFDAAERKTDTKTDMKSDRGHIEFKSSLAGLFVPTLIIIAGYGLVWLWLFIGGQGQSSLARLCMFVLILGTPLLSAYNLIRYVTINIKIFGSHVMAHKGFPARDPVDIPLAFIESVSISQGILGRFTNLSSVTLELSAQKNVVINDVLGADQVKVLLDEKLMRLSE